MISIIIPTLNEEKIIEKTLKSLREYHGDYEIVVSDGKSTDKTLEIARKYADKVIVYDGERRQTIGMGRNLGASIADGDYYLFLDADMFIPEPDEFFRNVLKFFENSKVVAITVSLKVFPEMATISDRIITWAFNQFVYILNNIFRSGASPGEFQMIKAEAFKKVNGFSEHLITGEDFDMFAKLSKIGKTMSVRSLFVYHTARRAHKVGWPKLLSTWGYNWLHLMFFGQVASKVWEEVR